MKRLGYSVHFGLPCNPKNGDIFVTWNRIRQVDGICRQFEAMGLPVLVTENAAWGNEFQGKHWNTIARGHHNTSGCFDYHGPERWDSLNVELQPFRTEGETVILPQRGIGAKPTAMPKDWPIRAKKKYRARVRQHPGKHRGAPLEQDLAHCKTVVTWGSGAAIKALMMGCHVISDMPNWIGRQDNSETGRLDMFRRLAWAQWTMAEIESGEAFARLL